ncbi:MAG: hypothetical protein GY938_12145, partial [Ketobacter sp.]|nr:hypothetical protein [Ketobacter sp.]
LPKTPKPHRLIYDRQIGSGDIRSIKEQGRQTKKEKGRANLKGQLIVDMFKQKKWKFEFSALV